MLDCVHVSNHLLQVPSVLEVKDLVKGLRSNELLLALQKLVHNHPGDIWVWSILSYSLVLVNQFGNLALSYLKLIVLKGNKID